MTLRRPDDRDRNNPGNPDDFDVVDGDGKIIGRVMSDANFFVAMSQPGAPGSSCHRNPRKERSNDCQG